VHHPWDGVNKERNKHVPHIFFTYEKHFKDDNLPVDGPDIDRVRGSTNRGPDQCTPNTDHAGSHRNQYSTNTRTALTNQPAADRHASSARAGRQPG
jgi:hypothetical protein